MRTLATLQEADNGTVFLGEIDVLQQKNELRQVLGYLPQQFGLYPKISAEVLLNHLAVLKGILDKKMIANITELDLSEIEKLAN